MKGKIIIFLIGIFLIILKWRGVLDISNWWIALIFAFWFLLSYISIHMKNKELATPKPVYLANP